MINSSGEIPLPLWVLLSILVHGLIIGAAELIGPENGGIPAGDSLQAQYRIQEGGETGKTGSGESPGREGGGGEDRTGVSISFETSDPKYQPYFKRLRGEIGKHWEQPRLAAGDPEKGSLLVEFVLGKGGDLQSVSVARSSGVMGFDFAAMEAVKSAAPFEPFPPAIGEGELEIRALFVYD